MVAPWLLARFIVGNPVSNLTCVVLVLRPSVIPVGSGLRRKRLLVVVVMICWCRSWWWVASVVVPLPSKPRFIRDGEGEQTPASRRIPWVPRPFCTWAYEGMRRERTAGGRRFRDQLVGSSKFCHLLLSLPHECGRGERCRFPLDSRRMTDDGVACRNVVECGVHAGLSRSGPAARRATQSSGIL